MFLLIALMGVIVDLGTKSWIFSKLWPPTPDKPTVLWLWKDHIGLQVSLNQGAVFGIGQGLVFWFALLSVLAVVGILYWLFILGEAKEWYLTFALSGITAGIFGNLFDRLGMHGLMWPSGLLGGEPPGTPIYAVRDWILLQWNDAWRWPNFNIADSLLVLGAIALLWKAYGSKSQSDFGLETEESADAKEKISND
ncbi:MAG: signal peptidase II [Planctomycetota bacterium]|nr:signal peptidase II [Planctomycetota bacterium]